MTIDPNLAGNPQLETAIEKLQKTPNQENLAHVLTLLRRRMQERGHFVAAVEQNAEKEELQLKTVTTADGRRWFTAFTGFEEQSCGSDPVMSAFTAEIAQIFDMTLQTKEVAGLILNPWRRTLMLDKQLMLIVIGEIK